MAMMRGLLRGLEERVQSIGNPELRKAAVYAFGSKVRSFAGELAMQTAAKGEPEAEIVDNSPKVKAAVRDALQSLDRLWRAVLSTEMDVLDISPKVRGRLAAEAREGHLNKYDPGSLLGAVVALLEREGLDDAAKAVRDVSRAVSRAWQERGK